MWPVTTPILSSSLHTLYNRRLEYFELKKNPLNFMKHKREKFSIGIPNLK